MLNNYKSLLISKEEKEKIFLTLYDKYPDRKLPFLEISIGKNYLYSENDLADDILKMKNIVLLSKNKSNSSEASIEAIRSGLQYLIIGYFGKNSDLVC